MTVRWMLIILLMCNGIYFWWQVGATGSNEIGRHLEVSNFPENADNLVLLKELRLEGGNEVTSVDAGSEPVLEFVEHQDGGLDPESDVCWLIGPFQEEISGKQAVSRMAAMGIDLQLLPLEVETQPDFWVHIPPQVSRKAAIKLLRELQAKKIDSFLITEGELENGISLGFYTQQERAQKVNDERVRQGYDAIIRIVPRINTQIWAVFNEAESGDFSSKLWQKIKEGNKGLERHKNYCDKIASTDNFD